MVAPRQRRVKPLGEILQSILVTASGFIERDLIN